MPVRNRKYEYALLCVFGAIICLVIANACYNVIERAIRHLLHR